MGFVSDLLGGSDEQETSTKVEYPKWWEQLYRPAIQDAEALYQEQSGQPLHPLQEEALAAIEQEARQGSSLTPAARQNVLGTLQQGGLAPEAMQVGQELTSGGYVNPAMDETRRIAMGGDVGSNPWLEAAYNRAADPLVERLQEVTNPNIDTAAAGAGRTGGGMHALLRNRAGEQVGEQLTDLATGIYGGAYEGDQARRMGALGNLGQLGQQDVANRIAGAGIYDTGTARTFQGARIAPALDETRYADLARLGGVGESRQMAPWQLTGQYTNLLTGLPGLGGSATQTAPGPNRLAGALQGGLGAASLASGLGASGGLTAGIGGLGALAAFSDEETKEDIEPVGITFGGTPLYKYRYKEEYGGGPARIGVIAQDVLETQPEAVTIMPEGLLGVRYDLIE